MEKNRLTSLDALRGFDMLFIMGGAGLIAALAKWLPCGLLALPLLPLPQARIPEGVRREGFVP